MKHKLAALLSGLLLLTLLIAGCADAKVPGLSQQEEAAPLVKAKIVFQDGSELVGYLKGLGIGEDTKVYVGGSTVTEVYDAHGNITAVFNYIHVSYIKVVK